MTWDLSYLASLAVFTFGALTFCVLTVSYWTQRKTRALRPFPMFTLVCAVAFVTNLLSQAGWLETAPMALIRSLPAGLLPTLMLHVIWEPGGRWRRATLAICYLVGTAAAIAMSLDDGLYVLPPVLLATSAALGIGVLARSQGAHRRPFLVLFALMLVFAMANLSSDRTFVRQAPDYLVLAFFGVTLYYRERLVFIDLLVKRGVFFGVGLVVLAGAFAFWMHPDYAVAALTLAFWLAAPWIYHGVARAVDSFWLRRPYSPAEAERRFIRETQAASTEDELRDYASRSLRDIFRTDAEVRLGDVEKKIVLAPRPDGIPFLSDDLRLLESLEGALGVVLENVRFREREQQLRLLASRAELKALRAQINPHFLFNTLSVIAGLVQYDPELAAETVEQLAQVFRYALRKSENEWATVGEEVEFVAAYLRIEQARFGARLRVVFEIEPEATQIRIPAMSIQPLVENAIKYGMSAKEHGGVVRLRAGVEQERLTIEVFDNGPGFPTGFSPDASAPGHGLRNIAERLRGYYGDTALLVCENGPDGARAAISLPQPAAVGVRA